MKARVQIGRWLCVLLVLMLVGFSVVACGANSSPTTPGGNPGTNQGGY
jgi:hypothetical protein